MSIKQIVGLSILALVLLFAFIFGTTNLSLWWKGYFDPKFANVEREIFEETKSYSHGKIQDLAKYYEEYTLAEEENKDDLKIVIQTRFAEFNAEKINSAKLRQFLKNMRGY